MGTSSEELFGAGLWSEQAAKECADAADSFSSDVTKIGLDG